MTTITITKTIVVTTDQQIDEDDEREALHRVQHFTDFDMDQITWDYDNAIQVGHHTCRIKRD